MVDLPGRRCYINLRHDQSAQRAATYDLGVLEGAGYKLVRPHQGTLFALGEFDGFDGFGFSLGGARHGLPAAT